MKKLLMVAFMIMAILVNVTAQQEQPADFKKTQWGMTKEEVVAAEGRDILRDEDEAIVYSDSINSLECELFYMFIDNILTKAGYNIIEQHTDMNLYLNDYQGLKQLLIKKYGKPKIDHVIWRNDLFRNQPNMIGLAISAGHVGYQTTWETDTTDISLVLFGDNAKITLMILYESKAYKEMSKQAQEEKTLQQL